MFRICKQSLKLRLKNCLVKFFKLENVAALVLLVAAVCGFAAANWFGAAHQVAAIFDFEQPDLPVTLRFVVVTIGLSGFFFLVGTELKRELTHGMFAERRRLVPPLAAATLGVLIPAVAYLAITRGAVGSNGWAIPTATDLTFSLAVFNLFGSWLGSRARLFLLAFAVIDDVIAVLLVTFLFSAKPNLLFLFLALVCAAVFALSQAMGSRWVFFLGLPAWLAAVIFTQTSGIEAALMAVWLGLLVPAERTVTVERRIHPYVVYLALPLFAFQATATQLGAVAFGAVFVGIAVRPVTKFFGLTLGGFLGSLALPRAERLGINVIARVAALGGIGFTVAMLVADLSFAKQPQLHQQAVAGTFVAAGASMLLGAMALVAGHRSKATDGA
mgnify:CR=1 FL=1